MDIDLVTWFILLSPYMLLSYMFHGDCLIFRFILFFFLIVKIEYKNTPWYRNFTQETVYL